MNSKRTIQKHTLRIRVGDTVRVLAGRSKGKTGKVMTVLPKKNRVIIDGTNIVKKHVRPRKQGEKGQRVSVSAPMDISNVKLVCSQCKKSTRVGVQRGSDGRQRVCKKCTAIL